MKIVAWTEWPDLQVHSNVDLRSTENNPLETSDLSDIVFYAPKYFGGIEALQYVEKMPSLKYLQVPNAGYEDALNFLRNGMILANAAGVHNESTAELAIGLTIAVRRGLIDFAKSQIAGKWNHKKYANMIDSRVGIVGFGSIGKTIARNLSGFALEIDTFSQSGTNGSKKIEELDSHLPNLDIVILILPLNASSEKLFNKDRLSLMKNGSLLVNVARGGIVDTEALLAELYSGRIYAALDVTDPEPLPSNHPLWFAPNIFITPHVGGDSNAFEPRGRKLVEEQLNRLARGEELMNIVARGKQ